MVPCTLTAEARAAKGGHPFPAAGAVLVTATKEGGERHEGAVLHERAGSGSFHGPRQLALVLVAAAAAAVAAVEATAIVAVVAGAAAGTGATAIVAAAAGTAPPYFPADSCCCCHEKRALAGWHPAS